MNMKGFVSEFFRRGLTACGFGPIILAVLYLVLQQTSSLEALSVKQVCMGIFSITLLAFVAGGMNSIYQIEKLPLMPAILIHGSVLYVGYLVTYLLNDWLEWNRISVLVFTGIFVVSYLAIWAVIYFVIKRDTERVNKMLKEKHRASEK